jgi:hypothetical protein
LSPPDAERFHWHGPRDAARAKSNTFGLEAVEKGIRRLLPGDDDIAGRCPRRVLLAVASPRATVSA